jgi:hypothetical protein
LRRKLVLVLSAALLFSLFTATPARAAYSAIAWGSWRVPSPIDGAWVDAFTRVWCDPGNSSDRIFGDLKLVAANRHLTLYADSVHLESLDVPNNTSEVVEKAFAASQAGGTLSIKTVGNPPYPREDVLATTATFHVKWGSGPTYYYELYTGLNGKEYGWC